MGTLLALLRMSTVGGLGRSPSLWLPVWLNDHSHVIFRHCNAVGLEALTKVEQKAMLPPPESDPSKSPSLPITQP